MTVRVTNLFFYAVLLYFIGSLNGIASPIDQPPQCFGHTVGRARHVPRWYQRVDGRSERRAPKQPREA